jgi:sugar diacid utilization regulator
MSEADWVDEQKPARYFNREDVKSLLMRTFQGYSEADFEVNVSALMIHLDALSPRLNFAKVANDIISWRAPHPGLPKVSTHRH